ncbi:ABC transporter ATP-binding protein [Fodinicola acaciae]|uniref:ABC transporter ATP-binding protein n=1 Tax=Fodinicola acaciae TaxID=2681555 RepID=UPI003CCCA1F7
MSELSIDLPVGRERRRVVGDVSLSLVKGESLGLVGESGSGKSITSRAILRVLPRTARVGGNVTYDGSDVYRMGRKQLRAWHASRVAMIYQDPRAHINPLHTVGDFITEQLRETAVSRDDAERRAASLLAQVGIPDADRRLRQYPHQLSGGLLQRVMIASSLLCEPEMLIADEPTTALDVTTQADVVATMNELRDQRELGLIFITHDLDLAAAVTNRIAVMYAGTVVEVGTSAAVTTTPRHPYTAGLLRSRPSAVRKAVLEPIPGRALSSWEVERGCAFASRCTFATDHCRQQAPQPRQLESTTVACHRADELADQLSLGGER